MNIFNSLGSNYSTTDIINTLFLPTSIKDRDNLISLLNSKYNGRTIITYKGREAIYLALKMSNIPKDSFVAVNGFTCIAVISAIEKAGYKPVFIDTDDKNNLNFSYANFVNKSKNTNISAVIIQNTLGYPCDINSIYEFCKKNKIILIEDLAHSVGTFYGDKESGNFGDFVALSFSQDKIIDGVTGGALIVKNNKKIPDIDYEKISIQTQFINKIYPLMTFLIRSGYKYKIGKLLHLFLRKMNSLPNPIKNIHGNIHYLPNINSRLIKNQFNMLSYQLGHRKKIARIYQTNLPLEITSKIVNDNIDSSTNIRYPIFISGRNQLLKYLKTYGIYISDIWYDAPVSPIKYSSNYNQNINCDNFQDISEKIVNLPTHINISESQAIEITSYINKWLKLNEKK
jgi:perosamine synthetase